MKKLHIYTFLLIAALMGACTEEFEEINTNTNAPTENNPATLLPSVIFEPLRPLQGFETWFPDQIMHYYMHRNDNQVDVYQFTAFQSFYDEVWRVSYSTIWNANDMMAAAQEQGLDAYVGAGKIIKAFLLATNSEIWIDVPASQAGLNIGNTTPSYDAQQAIYTSILQELEEANTLLAGSNGFVAGGDVLFNGDVMRWRKLANSLRIRYLLRLSNRSEVNAATQISTIVSDPVTYPIITGNGDAGVYDMDGITPNRSAFLDVGRTAFSGLSMSERVEEVYASYGDPRVDFIFRTPANSADFPNHEGVPNGITREAAQSWNGNGDENTSLIDFKFIDQPGLLDFVYISYAELQFMLAEVAMKGWINTGTSAEEYYEAGIAANFDQWGLDLPAGFFDLPEVAWDNTMERLMDQKWMAFFFNNTNEAWAEHKRTGLPALELGSLASSVSGGLLPTRVFYPVLEQSINSSNYESASSSIGGDNITARHWYQDR
ncbi:MAG: SusD/RagB family nutrient-binding outer membrane lipoprotein [Bacteroidota bacterium]